MGYYDIENREVKLSEDELKTHINELKITIEYFIILINSIKSNNIEEITKQIKDYIDSLNYNFYLHYLNMSYKEIEKINYLTLDENKDGYIYSITLKYIVESLEFKKDKLNNLLNRKIILLKNLKKKKN